jgi:hypothetical protein
MPEGLEEEKIYEIAPEEKPNEFSWSSNHSTGKSQGEDRGLGIRRPKVDREDEEAWGLGIFGRMMLFLRTIPLYVIYQVGTHFEHSRRHYITRKDKD